MYLLILRKISENNKPILRIVLLNWIIRDARIANQLWTDIAEWTDDCKSSSVIISKFCQEILPLRFQHLQHRVKVWVL